MTLVNRLAKYFKYCLYEEAKISAFSNLHKEDNIVVKLKGYEKIFHNFPTPYVAQEESATLTQIMLKQQVDKKKQLIYGYIFINGTPFCFYAAIVFEITNNFRRSNKVVFIRIFQQILHYQIRF